ncbi:HPr family phosphocarrier protein [Halopiger aswanensis]|uniref:Phosphocarrier protein HPr n=1 Tax=Halopiger aswanensis TaxID=148449 RepID=A0A3R7FY94_9EURY|nr:HPr family phosphocarrier protein [Halopiger aswanensis]RKD98013.1 phosphocarrier protein HPr [Halopiger aswanensis]
MDGERVGERARARTRTVTVAADEGLHARPAADIVDTVAQFDAEVRIEPVDDADNDDGDRDDDPVAATSVLAVTSLGVASGDDVRLTAAGDDAAAALDALEELLATQRAATEGKRETDSDSPSESTT